MAISNHERVGRALNLLRDGLKPYVEREMQAQLGDDWIQQLVDITFDNRLKRDESPTLDDVQVLLVIIDRFFTKVFNRTLGKMERSLVNELLQFRNQWAHQNPFSSDDTDRALDSATRLLTSISAPQADEIEQMKRELRKLVQSEQVRTEKRKLGGSLIEAAASGALKPWREVATPHPDVASGQYQQAEFAADLWQVHLEKGIPEYLDPVEFFRRTYLTQSLKELLVNGIARLQGRGGDPVVQLQTNFGGGKTHSMLALYHLFSGITASELPGIDELMAQQGFSSLPKARRVVLVGNKISPGNPSIKPDGTRVRTLWGELAYQLGGPAAYQKIAQDDELATSPGDLLRELFVQYGPCLILVDEWVAYARQLHDGPDLPGGSFETQFSFAQALTESAKLAPNCLLVVSLPASDTTSDNRLVEDVEVGGLRGRDALDRLGNVVGRLESNWRPATAEEGFEIVRRRLFEPLQGDAFVQRDITARAFVDFYRKESASFPIESRSPDYEKRMQAAFPIHPEIFDRLYGDWSTLVRFQRTRGVLRLMAAVIHCLWREGDRSSIILPASIPIDDSRVQSELTRYLEDNWTPIIARDVDGPDSLPVKIDGEVTNLGKVQATQRVARTVYLGSAPTVSSPHRGLEDNRVKLGSVLPGESPEVFSDALRRLASRATYLYQDGSRVWYDTQPTVTKLAEDRAEQLGRQEEKTAGELERVLKENLKAMGDFDAIHILPNSAAEVPDDMETRLVVLRESYSKGSDVVETVIRNLLQSRGTASRLYRNALVFLAPDQQRLVDLQKAIQMSLAWRSIVNDKESLNLTPFQERQARTRLSESESRVLAQLPEVYQWLFVPEQSDASSKLTLATLKLTGSDPLAVRASKKLRSDELLLSSLSGVVLRTWMDKIPLWRGGDHVLIRQLLSDFASYPYLPRLRHPQVLIDAIQQGLGLLSWNPETFAYADRIDQGNYQGLRVQDLVPRLTQDDQGMLVLPRVAQTQLDQRKSEQTAPRPPQPGQQGDGRGTGNVRVTGRAEGTVIPAKRRYYGRKKLDPTRVSRDVNLLVEEILIHLNRLEGAQVEVTLEIQARVEGGLPDATVRTVGENSKSLGFESHGFEDE